MSVYYVHNYSNCGCYRQANSRTTKPQRQPKQDKHSNIDSMNTPAFRKKWTQDC